MQKRALIRRIELAFFSAGRWAATWEVVRIQQSGFCQFPASRKFPNDEWYIKMIHFLRNGRIQNKNDVKKKKNDFSVGDLMGWTPDQKRKSTEIHIFIQ